MVYCYRQHKFRHWGLFCATPNILICLQWQAAQQHIKNTCLHFHAPPCYYTYIAALVVCLSCCVTFRTIWRLWKVSAQQPQTGSTYWYRCVPPLPRRVGSTPLDGRTACPRSLYPPDLTVAAFPQLLATAMRHFWRSFFLRQKTFFTRREKDF
jgi:hypothetical protein